MKPHSRVARHAALVAILLAAAPSAEAGRAPERSLVTHNAAKPILTATAGRQYTASARIRASRRGRLVCLRLRETARGARPRSAVRCARSTGRWQRLAVRRYRARLTGSRLRVSISRSRRIRLRVAAISLTSLACRPKGGCTQPQAPLVPPSPSPSPSPTPPPTALTPPPPPAADIPKVQPPPAPSLPAVGTQFHCTWSFYTDADRRAVLDKLAAAGVRWVRIDVGWDSIEGAYKGERNQWYIGMVDRCVNEARARGMQVLVTLWLTPGWANANKGNRFPPTDSQDYADFARWAAGYWAGRVAAWEVWNEPDPVQSYWRGTTEEYVALLRAAYPAFKAGDPSSQVVLGAPSSNDDAWISRVYALGGRDGFDVLATHPYQGFADAPPEHAGDGHHWWFTHLPAVRRVMVANGDAHKPIWFTEFGWSEHPNWAGVENWNRGVSPETQGDYLVRAIRYTAANYSYVPVMFWYKERSRPGGSDVHLEGYGLLRDDLSERPAYGALRTLLTG